MSLLFVMPAEARIHADSEWTPAFAGVMGPL
jgi:hypothetical protein